MSSDKKNNRAGILTEIAIATSLVDGASTSYYIPLFCEDGDIMRSGFYSQEKISSPTFCMLSYEIPKRLDISSDSISDVPTFCGYNNPTTNDYSQALSLSFPIEIASKREHRYAVIIQSLQKHSEGLLDINNEHLLRLANAICKLQFKSNLTYYNEDSETINTILKLLNGLTLSITQFLDEDSEASVVFSIHRNKALLISDELPLSEIVNIINSTQMI